MQFIVHQEEGKQDMDILSKEAVGHFSKTMFSLFSGHDIISLCPLSHDLRLKNVVAYIGLRQYRKAKDGA